MKTTIEIGKKEIVKAISLKAGQAGKIIICPGGAHTGLTFLRTMDKGIILENLLHVNEHGIETFLIEVFPEGTKITLET